MAGSLSADDKLLGEKMDYYCSSSEDEQEPVDVKTKENESSSGTSNGLPLAANVKKGRSTNVCVFKSNNSHSIQL